MKKTYLSCDPGLNGGFAIITTDGKMHTYKMPKTEEAINTLITSFATHKPLECCLEAVHSFPGQGVVSSFTFGRGYGFLRACFISNGIEIQDVQPRTWQKAMRVVTRGRTESKTNFKNRMKSMAQELHPELKVTLATADAILICHYSQLINR